MDGEITGRVIELDEAANFIFMIGASYDPAHGIVCTWYGNREYFCFEDEKIHALATEAKDWLMAKLVEEGIIKDQGDDPKEGLH
jgi:hypothetical protein